MLKENTPKNNFVCRRNKNDASQIKHVVRPLAASVSVFVLLLKAPKSRSFRFIFFTQEKGSNCMIRVDEIPFLVLRPPPGLGSMSIAKECECAHTSLKSETCNKPLRACCFDVTFLLWTTPSKFLFAFNFFWVST